MAVAILASSSKQAQPAQAWGGFMSESASSVGATKRPGTLLEQVQAEEGEPKRRRASFGNDVEKAVIKSLRDNFKGFTSHQTDVMLVEGKTLRDRLVADKRQHMQDLLYPCKNLMSHHIHEIS